MKLLRRAGATSQIFQIFIQDSSSTVGAGLSGLTSASAGLTAYYHRDTDTTATVVALVTMTVGTFTSSGFKEIDATNMPGWYQFCPPNAALAAGAVSCALHLKGATNMAPLPIEVDLDGQVDVFLWNGTAVATPATAGVPDVNVKNINNVSASSVTTVNANIGLTQAATFDANNLLKVDVEDWKGGVVPAVTVTGVPKVDVVDWLGTAVTAATAGIPDVNTKNINNVAAATPGASGGVLISGSNAGTTTLGALTVTGATTLTGGLAVSAGATITGSANGVGLTISGGGTSGAGLVVNTTSGDAVQLTPTVGHGLNIAANGTSKHGITSTGGTAGTSDGIKAVAGIGGVDLRANITGNVTGNLSGSAGSVTGAVGSVSAAVTVGTINAGAITTVSCAAGFLTSALLDNNTFANALADSLLDRSAAIETGITPRLALRYISSAAAGTCSGGGTATMTYKGVNVATTRIVGGTLDANGNRGTVTLS